MKNTVLAISLLIAITPGFGCNALSQISNRIAIGLQTQNELAEIRQDTRSALADEEIEQLRREAERERELARMEAEREQLERELCMAREEAMNKHIRSQVGESVESKVSFDVFQGLDIGELEVDIEELKELLKERENAEREAATRPPAAPLTCSCAEKTCGCGRIKRWCNRCRHRPCDKCEESCGREAIEALSQSPRRILRPTEIPMKLPVRLSFGFDNPDIEDTRIVREPVEVEPVQRDCCSQCGCDVKGCECTSTSLHSNVIPYPSTGAEAFIPPRPVIDRASSGEPPSATASSRSKPRGGRSNLNEN